MNFSSWREQMLSDLIVAGLAQRTQQAYLRAVQLLSRFYSNTDPATLNTGTASPFIADRRSF
jgi:hypothetical protein